MMIVDQPHQPLFEHMGIDLRCRDIGVAKQLLNGSEVGAVLQQMAGKSMAKHVRPCRSSVAATGSAKNIITITRT